MNRINSLDIQDTSRNGKFLKKQIIKFELEGLGSIFKHKIKIVRNMDKFAIHEKQQPQSCHVILSNYLLGCKK